MEFNQFNNWTRNIFFAKLQVEIFATHGLSRNLNSEMFFSSHVSDSNAARLNRRLKKNLAGKKIKEVI